MRILALDIETRPALAYVWGIWDQNISLSHIVETGGVICFASKWVGEKKVDFYSDQQGHEAMIQQAWNLLDEADAVLHFNGSKFDIPHLQREFMEAHMTPPSPFKQIDLLKTVRTKGRFLSNRLAHIAPQLGLRGKIEHGGFGMWLKCMAGDEKAWRQMQKYNIRDVVELEKLYLELRPWIPTHPTHTDSFNDEGTEACRVCSSTNLERRGLAHTATFSYQRVKCRDCGSWGKTGKAIARAEVGVA